MTSILEQDQQYWDDRFGGDDWTKNGGNYQSVMFMRGILDAIFDSPLAGVFRRYARYEIGENAVNFTDTIIHEYGCAQGDGTALLKATFPMARVTGYDWSPAGVLTAQARYPTLDFHWGDIRTPQSMAHVIFTSHTLEHLPNPDVVVANLLNACEWLVIAVPPISADNIGGHEDAMPYKEWVQRVRPKPVHEHQFETVRIVGDQILIEGTAVLIFQGKA